MKGRRGWIEAQRGIGGVVDREAGLLHYGEAVGEGLQDGARGVRLAPRRQGATAGEAGREAPGAAGVVSVMSRARERETRRLSLSFLRYEGTEMRDGMGVVNNGMGGARTAEDDECWPQQRACL